MNKIYRVLALLLALLVFVTSAGLSVDIHYCQGQAKTFSVFGEAKGCSDLEHITPLSERQDKNACGDSMGKRKCCENEFQYFQPDQNKITQASTTVSAKPAIPVSVVVYANNWESNHNTPAFSRYKPPPILRDIPVLMQVFRL